MQLRDSFYLWELPLRLIVVMGEEELSGIAESL